MIPFRILFNALPKGRLLLFPNYFAKRAISATRFMTV